MVAVACVTNNLSSDRVYPQYWWPSAEEAESEESEPETLLGRYFKKFQGAKARGKETVVLLTSFFVVRLRLSPHSNLQRFTLQI